MRASNIRKAAYRTLNNTRTIMPKPANTGGLRYLSPTRPPDVGELPNLPTGTRLGSDEPAGHTRRLAYHVHDDAAVGPTACEAPAARSHGRIRALAADHCLRGGDRVGSYCALPDPVHPPPSRFGDLGGLRIALPVSLHLL
jgi:hypothetical protein